jgi:hypothetical protein
MMRRLLAWSVDSVKVTMMTRPPSGRPTRAASCRVQLVQPERHARCERRAGEAGALRVLAARGGLRPRDVALHQREHLRGPRGRDAASPGDLEEEAGGVVGREKIPARRMDYGVLAFAPVGALGPGLAHGEDVAVALRLEPAGRRHPPLVPGGEFRRRQLRPARRAADGIDDRGGGVVVGMDDHVGERALQLG